MIIGGTDKKMPEEAVRNFGIKVAEAMDVLKSSQVFFILQQAYPEYADDWEWADFQELISAVCRSGVKVEQK